MVSRPRLLDLFCGAGGSAMGYYRAGFDIVGVDNVRMPDYPFPFIQADAVGYGRRHAKEFDVINASPPCQTFSKMSACRPGLKATYRDLISPTRELMERSGKPYVIENVKGSSVRPDLILCGQMVGLALYRHRYFESNVSLPEQMECVHTVKSSRAGHPKPGTIISVAGHVYPIAMAEAAMGIDWMSRDELVEAIPPAYTELIGRQLLRQMGYASATASATRLQ